MAKLKVTSCGITDLGRKRQNNEDNYLINDELNLYIVADGMGGHAGGEFASQIAVNTVEEVFSNLDNDFIPTTLNGEISPDELTREKLEYAIRLAGRRIYEKALDEPEYRGMGTTALALHLQQDRLFISHVGDSRGYRIRKSGIEQLTGPASFAGQTPYGATGGKFGWTYGLANYHATDAMFEPSFELMLRLFKADLTSAVHLYLPELYFDRHSGQQGHQKEFVDMRGGMDCIGRLLGEMKRTTLPSGKTLLDDTLVVIFSEFARTWASGSSPADFNYPDDHWPFTSVTLVGGGLAGGRAVGGYDLSGFAYGPRGLPVEIHEEDGSTRQRPPTAADVTATVLRVLGLGMHDFFIPGGYGEIAGVRAT